MTRTKWVSCGLLLLVIVACGAALSLNTGPRVVPAELFALIDSADTMTVSEKSLTATGLKWKKLFESSDAKDRQALKDSLEVHVPRKWFRCGCSGTPIIRLYRNGKEIGSITNHHGQKVRTSVWDSDARLQNPEKWLAWFDARQISSPREEYRRMEESRQATATAKKRWEAARPAALQGTNFQPNEFGFVDDIAPLSKALQDALPDVRQRVFVLLHWFGSGEGPWSGYPCWEDDAQQLLLEITTADLLAAVEGATLTPTQTEGLARFLASFEFSRKRVGDIKLVPEELKKKLLQHSLTSNDQDKIDRARAAFEA